MKLQLELSEELGRALVREAANQRITVEELAIQIIEASLKKENHKQAVQRAGDYVQKKNDALYQRFA